MTLGDLSAAFTVKLTWDNRVVSDGLYFNSSVDRDLHVNCRYPVVQLFEKCSDFFPYPIPIFEAQVLSSLLSIRPRSVPFIRTRSERVESPRVDPKSGKRNVGGERSTTIKRSVSVSLKYSTWHFFFDNRRLNS